MTAPDTQTPKPLRADARRNRERIIAAARTVFAERGVEAQMDDVAREAGVGVGTVYRHFPHKEALLGELVAQKFRAFGDNAERALAVEDPWEAFAGLLRANAELCVRDVGMQEALARTPEAWRLADAEFQRLDALANQLVARAQAAGVLRPDFAVAEIPMLMSGLYTTMAVLGLRLAPPPRDHPRRAARLGTGDDHRPGGSPGALAGGGARGGLCQDARVISRSDAVAALRSERFDVVVVGGGITGAGVALDAATRGYSVALVEKADYASGTSSRSSKLVHGGLRYLQNFDLGPRARGAAGAPAHGQAGAAPRPAAALRRARLRRRAARPHGRGGPEPVRRDGRAAGAGARTATGSPTATG